MAVPAVEHEKPHDPILSVIVPVLNTRGYIEACLDSLVAQTLKALEVICVDNGSTDGSYEFLRAYAGNHPHVTVLRHPQGRQGGARNAGIEVAQGEYVGFVDSDDIVSPDMFQAMYGAADARGADVVICNMALYDRKDRYRGQTVERSLLDDTGPFLIEQRPRLLRNLTIGNKLFSQRLIEKHQLRFPERVFHEDQFFVVAALTSAARIAAVPDSLYCYCRGRPGSVSQRRGPHALHVFQVMQRISAFVDDRTMTAGLRSLVGEVQALKYLETYRLVGGACRGEYFQRMKDALRDIELADDPQILSPSEARECGVVRRWGHEEYRLFLLLRSVYGTLRKYAVERHLLGSRRRQSRARVMV